MKKSLLLPFFLCFFLNSNVFSQTPILLTPNLQGNVIPLNDFLGLNCTDVNKPGLGFDNSTIVSDLNLTNVSTLRFPGGTVANWWDWERGQYIPPINPATGCFGLPFDYGATLPQNNNSLANFKLALIAGNAKPVFVLNMLSSDLSYQLSMLSEASVLGIPVNYIELGNEFYLDNDCSIEKYPDGTSYGQEVSIWVNAIRSRFPNVHISCVGATTYTNATPRRDGWNTELRNYFNSNPTNIPDAFSIHDYKKSGLNNSQNCADIDYSGIKKTCTTSVGNISNWKYLFGNVFNDYQDIQTNDYPEINPAGSTVLFKYWLTEYNLLDRNSKIHGTWAHALHTALMTTLYVQDAGQIEHLNCHSLIGNGVFSSIFNTINGYDYANSENPFCKPCSSNLPPTSINTLTASGLVMSEIGKAMKNAISAQSINFGVTTGTLPLLLTECAGNNTHPGIIGWKFTDSPGNESIILLNLSDQVMTISNISSIIISAPSVAKYQTYAFSLESYLTGYVPGANSVGVFTNANCNPSAVSINSASNVSANQISVPPFSLTRVWQYNNLIQVKANSNSVCAGSSLMLVADANPDASNFQWYVNGNSIGLATSKSYFATPTTGANSYSVSATINGITVYSPSVSITINPKPSVSFPNNSLTYGCVNTPLTLTAIASGGSSNNYLYNWAPNLSSGNGLSSQCTFELDKSKTVTVYVSDGTCSNKASIQISALGEYDFKNIPDRLCNTLGGVDETYSIILPPPPTGVNVAYLWSNGSTANTFQIPNASGPVYSGTITYTNSTTNQNICTLHKTFQSDIIDCCESTSTITHIVTPSTTIENLAAYLSTVATVNGPNDNNSYDISTIGGGPSNAITILVKRNFTIDNDLKLTNFNIILSEGAKIIIPPYRTLNLTNCRLNSCNNTLWDGIIVNEHGSIKLVSTVTNGTVITDARNAIQLKDYSEYKISRATFIDNLIGIKIIGSDIYINRTFGSIIGSTFTSTNYSIKNGYSGMTEVFSNKPFSGIDMNFGLLSMSQYDNTPNTFSNLTCGVSAQNSILDIGNAMFLDLQEHPDVTDSWNGTGIYNNALRGNTYTRVDQSLLTDNNINSFENCIRGIYTGAGETAISFCNMHNVITGIYTENVTFSSIGISGNSIDAVKNGIVLYKNDGAGKINMDNNIISLDDPTLTQYTLTKYTNTGILLNELGMGPLSRLCDLKCNYLNLDNSLTGFMLNNVRYPGLYSNSVNFNHSNNRTGFSFSATHEGVIQQNGVVSLNTISISPQSKSYLLSLSGENDLINNYSDKTSIGFDFWGNNYPLNLIGNRINTHYKGLHINKSGIIGPQPVAGGNIGNGNRWLAYQTGGAGYGSGYGAENENIGGNPGNPDPVAPYFSQFLTNEPNAGTIYHPYNIMLWFPNPTTTDWFKYDQNAIPIIPSFQNLCIPIWRNKIPRTFNVIDSLITLDSISALEFENEIRWMTADELFVKLYDDSIFRLQNDLYRNYYDSLLNYNIGKLGLVKIKMESLYLMNENDQNQLNELNTAISSGLIAYRQRDSLLNSGTLSLDDSISMENQAKLSFTKIIEANIKVKNFKDSKASEMLSIITEALVLNESVDPVNLIEENEKFLNEFILTDFIEPHQPTNLEIEHLKNIAHQCPFSGGSSVYRARAILAKLYPEEEYDDLEICQAEGLMRRASNFVPTLSISPNPTQNYFQINYENELDPIQNIEISNTTGSIVMSIAYKFMVSVSELTPGIYFLKCKTLKGNILKTKLVVLK